MADKSDQFQGYPIKYLQKLYDAVVASGRMADYIAGTWTPFVAEEKRLDKSEAGVAHRKKYAEAAKSYFGKPEVDPALDATQSLQLKQAQSFRQNLPIFQKQLGYDIDTAGAQDLAKQVIDVNRGANRRGLLWGGTRAEGERSARVGAAGESAKKKMQTNEALQGIQSNLDQAPINTGMMKTGQQGQVQALAFNDKQKALMSALERRNMNDAATSDLLKNVGKVGGYVAGSL